MAETYQQPEHPAKSVKKSGKEVQMIKRLLFCLALFSTVCFGQKYTQLALTPPMGWNTWNKFACDVNEFVIREIADAMVSSGMKDAGYQYIVIDDCWSGGRDSLGFLFPNPEKFPSGMKRLSDYIHSKGLKFGIYSDAGDKTCGGFPGSRGHEYQDAMMFAKWGVDYLKYDWCNAGNLNAEEAYKTMRDALYAAGRPVVFSLCEWGNNKPWLWGSNIGHLWRTTGDIYACWGCEVLYGIYSSWGWTQILDRQKDLRIYAGPGHWNDLDMLEVGNGMLVNEDRAHFSLWCMLASPLIAGNDLRNMSKATADILTNSEVIAVDQDSLGIQGFNFIDDGDLEIWLKPLKNKNFAFCFFNRGTAPRKLEFNWQGYNIKDSHSNTNLRLDGSYKIRDLWAKKDIGTTKYIFKAVVPAHDVVMVRVYK
jgi:alpha-galactosidase